LLRAVDIIQRKRDGAELTPEEIAFFVRGHADGSIPDYQASAFTMAVYFRGMSGPEIVALTDAMMRSGERLDLSELAGPKVDKHSTGGVGDKTSLILAPVVAACGAYVPMISGRGLGHTGGTLDKLEAIPGFRTDLSLSQLRDTLRRCRMGLIGQTPEIAPADKKLYALRDVTATVESLPLISASIMSKKMAEGIDALVLDVKTGGGAFLPRYQDSLELARTMVGIGRGMGRRVVALVSDMEQPLGRACGNALETVECLQALRGDAAPEDLMTLSLELSAHMLLLAGSAPSLEAARVQARGALASGAALEAFRECVRLQGGEPRVCDDPGLLPHARERFEVEAGADGFLARIACRELGQAIMRLGGGRERVQDAIDPAVGVVLHRKVGDRVSRGDSLASVHWNDRARFEAALPALRGLFAVTAEAPAPRPLIHTMLTEEAA
jgi:pyrimidine-nucleoside phosphorylase/thymidine phosphorylase